MQVTMAYTISMFSDSTHTVLTTPELNGLDHTCGNTTWLQCTMCHASTHESARIRTCSCGTSRGIHAPAVTTSRLPRYVPRPVVTSTSPLRSSRRQPVAVVSSWITAPRAAAAAACAATQRSGARMPPSRWYSACCASAVLLSDLFLAVMSQHGQEMAGSYEQRRHHVPCPHVNGLLKET